MPRIQVYLPDTLYRAVKELGLPASELLQEAVRVEVERRSLLRAGEAYLADLTDEVGAPTAADIERAEGIARRILEHQRKQAG